MNRLGRVLVESWFKIIVELSKTVVSVTLTVLESVIVESAEESVLVESAVVPELSDDAEP